MPIVASAPQNDGADFSPAPAGTHQGVCCDVVDLGVQELNFNGQISHKHQIRIMWQINEQMEDGRPFIVSKKYNLSLHEKATLRKDLKAWRGRDFTEKELQGFDVETLIGANCMLAVSHSVSPSNGRTYANVDSVGPLMKGLPKMEVSAEYVRKCDREGWVEPSREMPAKPAGGDGAQARPAVRPAATPAPGPIKHPLEDADDELPF